MLLNGLTKKVKSILQFEHYNYFCTMFLRGFKTVFVALLLVIIASSCSQYEKLLKSSNISLKYKKALQYYNNGEYTRATTLFEQIKSYYKGSMKSDTIDFFYAQCFFKQQDYIMGEHYFDEFSQMHPRSIFTEEADYMTAYCYYMTSPRAQLDQKNTYDAITEFQLFMAKHPQSMHIKECRAYIVELHDKLAEKSFLNAKLYYNLKYYKAAIIALHNSLNEYPDTRYREEMMYLLLRSNFLLAQNSIESKQKERFQETVDTYYSFIAEFPNSKYQKDVQRMYDASAHVLHL